jgi:glycosyl transferase family 25
MKAFIITMSESKHSTELAADCIVAANKHGIEVTVWPAVNGLYSAEKFQQYGIKNFLHKKMSLVGVQGCFLSHYELWQKCVDLNEPILILEHDGYMIRSLPADVHEHYTDVLNLDPYGQSSNEYDSIVKDSVRLPIDYRYVPGGKRSAAGEYIAGAYGYLIKPHAAVKLINFSKNSGALPTDKHIGRNIVDLKSTTVPIIRLHEFYSTHSIRKFSSTKNLQEFIK